MKKNPLYNDVVCMTICLFCIAFNFLQWNYASNMSINMWCVLSGHTEPMRHGRLSASQNLISYFTRGEASSADVFIFSGFLFLFLFCFFFWRVNIKGIRSLSDGIWVIFISSLIFSKSRFFFLLLSSFRASLDFRRFLFIYI